MSSYGSLQEQAKSGCFKRKRNGFKIYFAAPMGIFFPLFVFAFRLSLLIMSDCSSLFAHRLV